MLVYAMITCLHFYCDPKGSFVFVSAPFPSDCIAKGYRFIWEMIRKAPCHPCSLPCAAVCAVVPFSLSESN